MQLLTNDRSAYYLAKPLNDYVMDNQKTFVASKYIVSNALEKVPNFQRRRVVRAVLRLLWEYSKPVTKLTWPYDMLKQGFPDNEKFQSEEFGKDDVTLIFSLLDINMEFVGSTLKLVDNKRFSVEISPALTIVLYQLLGVLATEIASLLSAFEVLVALNELSQIVVFSDSVEEPYLLHFLCKPVPSGASKINYVVPRLDPRSGLC